MIRIISALDKLFPAPKDGAPGADAVVYRIVCSNATPNVTDSAAVITLTAMKITGSKREKAALSSSLYFTDGTNSYVSNPLTVAIAKGNTSSRYYKLMGDDQQEAYDEVTISPFTDGNSFEVQYCKSKSDGSPDDTNIFNSFVDGCEWMRTKMTTESNFSGWFRIVGEKGESGPWTDYTFNLSSDLSTDGSAVEPTHLYQSYWQDKPLLPIKEYPYLWMKIQKYSDATTKDGYPRYVRLTGEQGPAGTSVLAQYSSDAINWHDPYLKADKWMRTSKDGGQTWSSEIRIVGEKGDGGAWTDYTFNNSTAKTIYTPTTAPFPTGRSTWQDAPVATTDAWPYLWMKVQKYSDETTKDGEPTYVRLTGEQGEKGDPGDKGDDGNGIVSQTSLFLASDQANMTTYNSSDMWSETFPNASEEKPYVWKCVKTVYTKSSTVYSIPELVTVYQSGCNPNLLDNAAFRDDDHMDAWETKSSYVGSVPDDPIKHIIQGGQNGRNYYRDWNTRRSSESQYKEVLSQTIWSPGTIRKIKPSTWYTLSFWERLGINNLQINETSNKYGFATQKLSLIAGHQYRLVFNGRISSTAQSKGKSLFVYIFDAAWVWSTHGNTDSTSDKSITIDFTVPSTGEYLLEAYLSPNDSDRDTVDYGTATLNWVRVWDKSSMLNTYIYPSCVDTSVKGYIDGKETWLGSDAGASFNLGPTWDFVKHTITFKTKSSYSASRVFADEEHVLFRLQPTPMSGVAVQADICMPKLEEGMFATGFIDTYDDIQGKIGPMAFMSGEWLSTNTYTRTDSLTPIVHHNDAYWYQRKNGSSKGDEPSADSSVWRLAQQFELVIAKMLMAEFGKIASAVFCGDFMMSQKGRRFDTTKNDYIYDNDYKSFDPETYTESDDRDWRPLVAIDFKEGILRVVNMIAHGGQFHDVNVDGKVTANLFYGKTKDLTNVKDYTIDPVSEPANCYLYNEPAAGHYFVKLPKASDYDGLEISFFVKWNPQTPDGIPRLHIGCSESTDHMYCRCSATYDAGSSEKRFIPTFDNLNIGYTDFIGTTVTVYWNRFIRFKSMGGSWYAIEGVFTGE